MPQVPVTSDPKPLTAVAGAITQQQYDKEYAPAPDIITLPDGRNLVDVIEALETPPVAE